MPAKKRDHARGAGPRASQVRAAGATRGKPRMAAQLRPEEAPASKLSRRTSAGDRAVPTQSGAGRAAQVVKSTDAESAHFAAEAATTTTDGVEGVGTRLPRSETDPRTV